MIPNTDIYELILKRIREHSRVSLELGCGNQKRHLEAIGIDALDYDGVDIVGDIYSVLKQFPDKSVSAVYSYHCFEHLPDLGATIDQLGRIMRTDAELFVVVPHFSNPYYYSDSTHRQSFGLYTFSYFAKESIFARCCPNYQREICFELKQVKLIFKSSRPFYGRYAIKKLFQG